MRLSENLVPILSKSEFDDVAQAFLKKYYPRALETPMMVPIEEIAVQIMKLHIKRVRLSEDLSILGQIFFSPGSAEIYIKETEEFVYEQVDKGTVFLDPDVAAERNIGSERNTIAHECTHWHIHRSYHSVQIMAGGSNAVACRCPTEPPSEHYQAKWAADDWMEWQANGIAPKILMPRNMFVQYVNAHDLFHKMKNPVMSLLYRNLLIESLADFFCVSKQSASIRLTELDL